jgi:hypothetical protein
MLQVGPGDIRVLAAEPKLSDSTARRDPRRSNRLDEQKVRHIAAFALRPNDPAFDGRRYPVRP